MKYVLAIALMVSIASAEMRTITVCDDYGGCKVITIFTND